MVGISVIQQRHEGVVFTGFTVPEKVVFKVSEPISLSTVLIILKCAVEKD